jgi:hypothetical protein
MRLSELDAVFVGGFFNDPLDTSHWPKGRPQYYRQGIIRANAQGVLFGCPHCRRHSILIWFANPNGARVVPADAFPKNESRWMATGGTIDTLTLDPSIDLSKVTPENPASADRCYWHGHVKNGDAT